LLVHGLGGTWRSWATILPSLSRQREVLAIDLPGHGETPTEPGDGSGSFIGLADALDAFIVHQGLIGVSVVGSSMGARLALELARRGRVGATVALDPGGFWRGWERSFFRSTAATSIRLLRRLAPMLPAFSRNAAVRTMLLAQLSARPWALRPELVTAELESLLATPTFDALVRDLADGPEQKGSCSAAGPITIGWGRQDRLCLPRQAARAQAAFPMARIHWFENCGHFPIWDQPAETIEVILSNTR
jgi:pimeloyl-ACP methyl ester carboxylesterase